MIGVGLDYKWSFVNIVMLVGYYSKYESSVYDSLIKLVVLSNDYVFFKCIMLYV